jgi:hypothetical protein
MYLVFWDIFSILRCIKYFDIYLDMFLTYIKYFDMYL